ncbi:MAG: hypothetical protein GY827_01395 [Cytophagales bacterium]|nr:hypothetical protein [Cytophagales bacterium]
METKSNLLNYISHLMHNDDALQKFIIDPITTSEKEHGLTKAERSVLRRTVSGLSNNSLNGYSIQRNLDSYRRSLRLLQNVLVNTGHKMVMDNTETPEGHYKFSVQVFFPLHINKTNSNFTCQTNEYVKNNFGNPYAAYGSVYTATLDKPNPTIEEVMDASGISYEKGGNPRDRNVFVSGFNIYDFTVSADLSNECYDLHKNPNANYVFWFYSVNGKANPQNSGQVGESFRTKTLNPNDTVFWQLIAPDASYGFHPCAPNEGNTYAEELKKNNQK